MCLVNFKLQISVNHCSSLGYQLFAQNKMVWGSGGKLLGFCPRGPSAVVPSVVGEIRDKLCKQRYHKKRSGPVQRGIRMVWAWVDNSLRKSRDLEYKSVRRRSDVFNLTFQM